MRDDAVARAYGAFEDGRDGAGHDECRTISLRDEDIVGIVQTETVRGFSDTGFFIGILYVCDGVVRAIPHAERASPQDDIRRERSLVQKRARSSLIY